MWRPFEHLWFSVVLAAAVPMVVAGAFGWLVFSRRVRGPVLRPAHPGDGADLRADHGRPAEDVRRHQRPHRLPDRLRPQQVRPGAPTSSSTSSPPACCSSCSSSAATSCAAATAGCCSPSATARTGCASSATTRPSPRRSPSSSPPAWPARPVRSPRRSSASSPRTSSATLPSILMVCWVAVGGRGTLYGAVIGALLVNWGDHVGQRAAGPTTGSTCRACCSSSWWRSCPGGIVGLFKLIGQRLPSRRRADPSPVARSHRRSTALAGGWRRHDGAARAARRGRRLRRLQGRRRRRPDDRAGRAALPHRTERRRQDDADRRDHRADEAVGGDDHVRRPVARRHLGGQASPARHRPQLPDADRVRVAHRRREPRPRRDVPLRAAPDAAAAQGHQRRRRRARSSADRPAGPGVPPGRRAQPRAEAVAGDRHAAGAGAQAACCSTSRSPA